MGSTGKKAILAFRGSSCSQGQYDTLTWLDQALTSWNAHFDVRPKQYHSGKVQGNYLDSLQTIWPEITRLLRDHGAHDKNLWIAGHSLGGGLAALAGVLATWENNLEPAGVYTFGAPRVVDVAFALNYPAPLYRFENRNDLLPHLPPAGHAITAMRMLSSDIEEALSRWFGPDFPEMNFGPIGELRYINSKGRLLDEVDDRDRLIGLATAMLFDPAQLLQDHWIDSYCAAIDACNNDPTRQRRAR